MLGKTGTIRLISGETIDLCEVKALNLSKNSTGQDRVEERAMSEGALSTSNANKDREVVSDSFMTAESACPFLIESARSPNLYIRTRRILQH